MNPLEETTRDWENVTLKSSEVVLMKCTVNITNQKDQVLEATTFQWVEIASHHMEVVRGTREVARDTVEATGMHNPSNKKNKLTALHQQTKHRFGRYEAPYGKGGGKGKGGYDRHERFDRFQRPGDNYGGYGPPDRYVPNDRYGGSDVGGGGSRYR